MLTNSIQRVNLEYFRPKLRILETSTEHLLRGIVLDGNSIMVFISDYFEIVKKILFLEFVENSDIEINVKISIDAYFT